MTYDGVNVNDEFGLYVEKRTICPGLDLGPLY